MNFAPSNRPSRSQRSPSTLGARRVHPRRGHDSERAAILQVCWICLGYIATVASLLLAAAVA
jgi:hypothetical protein